MRTTKGISPAIPTGVLLLRLSKPVRLYCSLSTSPASTFAAPLRWYFSFAAQLSHLTSFAAALRTQPAEAGTVPWGAGGRPQ